ncbi:MAG: hypothetical protein RBS08_01705 [Bdellovibrionales bacterium]|jgi:hypothetical protein|nr:hypothetical protein [Bdellovibrionales bacterium]
MTVDIPFGKASGAPIHIRAAQTLDSLNAGNADVPDLPAAEKQRIDERFLAAVMAKNARMTDMVCASRGWPVLEIDLAGLKQREKELQNYETKLMVMIDGLEERGGIWHGRRLHIRTNDADVEKHMRKLEMVRGAAPPVHKVSLSHDVAVMPAPLVHKRKPKSF